MHVLLILNVSVQVRGNISDGGVRGQNNLFGGQHFFQRRIKRAQQILYLAVEAGDISLAPVAHFRPGTGLNYIAAGVFDYGDIFSQSPEPFRAAYARGQLFIDNSQPVNIRNVLHKEIGRERFGQVQAGEAQKIRCNERAHIFRCGEVSRARNAPSSGAAYRLQSSAPREHQFRKGNRGLVHKEERGRKTGGNIADVLVLRKTGIT